MRLPLILAAILWSITAWAQTVVAPSPSGLACAYNTSLPTLTAGTFGLVQCNSAGQLVVSSGGSLPPSGVTPVTGTFSGTGSSANFTPVYSASRYINLTISGTFVATMQFKRSFDNGVTWFPLTADGTLISQFTSPVSEQFSETESGVLYKLECTAYTSGSPVYRISQ